MKIGKQTLKLVERKPEEVDAGLLQLTGCGFAEIREALAYPMIAGTVAAALLPLLAEPIERHALAQAIAEAGVDDVRQQVRAAYDGLAPKEAPRAGKE